MSEANITTDSSGSSPGTRRGSVALVAVTLVLLGALVWALLPARPKIKPAPLGSPLAECSRLGQQFVPSNVTGLPEWTQPAPTASSPPEAPLIPQTPEQKHKVLVRINREACKCGCNLSVALCRLNNPHCKVSEEQLRQIVKEVMEREQPAPGKTSTGAAGP